MLSLTLFLKMKKNNKVFPPGLEFALSHKIFLEKYAPSHLPPAARYADRSKGFWSPSAHTSVRTRESVVSSSVSVGRFDSSEDKEFTNRTKDTSHKRIGGNREGDESNRETGGSDDGEGAQK